MKRSEYDPAGNLIKRTSGTQLAGDVVADGVIDLKDLIVTLQIAGAMSPEGANPRSDVNGDNRIGIEDAIFILEKVGGERSYLFSLCPDPSISLPFS